MERHSRYCEEGKGEKGRLGTKSTNVHNNNVQQESESEDWCWGCVSGKTLALGLFEDVWKRMNELRFKRYWWPKSLHLVQLPINIGFALLEHSSEYFHTVYEIYFEVLYSGLAFDLPFCYPPPLKVYLQQFLLPRTACLAIKKKWPGIPKGEKHNLKRQSKHRTIHGREAGIKRQQNSHEG